jgi:hypothetical protein
VAWAVQLSRLAVPWEALERAEIWPDRSRDRTVAFQFPDHPVAFLWELQAAVHADGFLVRRQDSLAPECGRDFEFAELPSITILASAMISPALARWA